MLQHHQRQLCLLKAKLKYIVINKEILLDSLQQQQYMQVQQYTCVFSEKGKTRTSQKLRDRIVPISISSFHLLSPFSSSIFFFLPFPIFHHSSSFFSSFLPPLCYSSSFLLFFLFFILFCCFFFLSFPWNKHMPAILFSPLTALSLQILQAFIEYYI